MKKILLLGVFLLCVTFIQATEVPFQKAEIKSIMRKVADWQIANPHPAPEHDDLNWSQGALYVGMVDWAELAEKEDNDDTYYKWLTRIGRRNCWQPDKRFYHADDIAVSQSFLDLYRKYKDEAMIIPTLARTEWIVNHPSEGSFKLVEGDLKTLERWTWCDALFMAPPVYAKLYMLTGEKKYIKFMNREYKATYDYLFDKEENLFYRDHRYFDMKRWRIADITWNGNTDNDKAIVYGLYPYRIAKPKPGTSDQDKYIFVKTKSERFKVARTFQQSNYYSFIADDVINNNPTIVKNPFQ